MLPNNGDRYQVVADDNVCTNPILVRQAIKDKLCNAVLIKLNQIGKVTETMETIRLARKNGMTTMVSHRSGEIGDTFIAYFMVALNGRQFKLAPQPEANASRNTTVCWKLKLKLVSKMKD